MLANGVVGEAYSSLQAQILGRLPHLDGLACMLGLDTWRSDR